MIDRHLAVLLLGVAMILGLAIAARAEVSSDSAYIEQIDRWRWTAFCEAVGRPPQRLADAIHGTMENDPTWAVEAAWFERIAERYEEAGCGET